MNEGTKQAGIAGNTRTLKIERAGDPYLGGIKPQIRLIGQWLERAGFKPGHHVEIRLPEPGTLSLRFIESPELSNRQPDRQNGALSASADSNHLPTSCYDDRISASVGPGAVFRIASTERPAAIRVLL